MKHVVYRTTNNINGKYYIGYHKTDDLSDDYLGSGKILKKAIEKYGRKAFTREILFEYDTKEEAFLKEFEIVNEEVVNDPMSYNIMCGGKGGWEYVNATLNRDLEFRGWVYEKAKQSLKESYASGRLKHMQEAVIERNRKMSIEGKTPFSKLYWENNPMPDSTKKKISENNGNKLSDKDLLEIKNCLDTSEIDFSKFGWVSKLAKLIRRKPQKVNYIMDKYFPEFYEEKCFKRKTMT